MPETFFISDHHFYHKNILTFRGKDEQFLRPEFDNVDEMNQFMIDQHNKTVGSKDTVYFLGDVTWKYHDKAKETLSQLNGKKFLTPGNHDDIIWLQDYFEDMWLWKKFPDHGFIISHIPLNKMDMERGYNSVHGHIHEKLFMKEVWNPDFEQFENPVPDERYFNVCVEQLGYTPISLEDLTSMLPETKEKRLVPYWKK